MGKEQLFRINRGTEKTRKFDNAVGVLSQALFIFPLRNGKVLYRKYEGQFWAYLKYSSPPLCKLLAKYVSSFDI